MARQVVEEILDDIDGSPGAETVRFGYQGQDYEIDITPDRHKELADALSDLIEKGRRVRRDKPKVKTTRGKSDLDLAEVRRWAAEHGIEVAARGRVPNNVLDKYRTAV